MSSAPKILVIDDDPSILELLSSLLSAEGFEVSTAISGAETISRVNELRPDLILLDMNFPPCSENHQSPLEDGFLIIAWLRGMSQAAKTPIIVISGADPEEYRNRILAMGVAATFQKPVDIKQLLEAIRTTLANHRQPVPTPCLTPTSADNDNPTGLKA